jgi:hypothetical protein
MNRAAEKRHQAQRAAAYQFAANALPAIESVKAAGATSFDAIATALSARGSGMHAEAPCKYETRRRTKLKTAGADAVRTGKRRASARKAVETRRRNRLLPDQPN